MEENSVPKLFIKTEVIRGDNETTLYSLEIYKTNERLADVFAKIQYRCIGCGDIALVIANKEFDKYLDYFGFEVIKKEVDLETGNVELIVRRHGKVAELNGAENFDEYLNERAEMLLLTFQDAFLVTMGKLGLVSQNAK